MAMDPTRPIDTQPIREPGSTVVGQIKRVADVTEETPQQDKAADVSISVLDAGRAIELAKAEAARIDAAELASLRDAVAEGRYAIDADLLAERILDDAIGEELGW